MRRLAVSSLLCLVVLLPGLGRLAQAQEYPAKPVKLVLASPAGSATDALARLLAKQLTAKWGKSVWIENRPGAGGNLAAHEVFEAPPDGLTFLIGPGPLVQKSLYPKLDYDLEKLVPLSVIAGGFSALVVNPKVPAQTLPELIAYAKAHPDKLNYASQGIGSIAQLTGEMFKQMAGVNIQHVPYLGNAPAITDLLGGQVDMMFLNFGSSLPLVQAGKLRALAVTNNKRSPLLPNVPSVSEVVPGFTSTVWWAAFGPPKIAPPLAAKISAAIHDALSSPNIQSWLSINAFTAIGSTPAQSTQFIHADSERWIKVIKDTGIKAE